MEGEVDGERQSSDWTYVYRSWESWQDPDEVARQKREASEKARKRADRAAFMYSRDRSVERRVFERPTHEKVAGIYRFRARGNLLFREGQFARAAIQYQAALTWYEYTFPSELGYRDVTSSGGTPLKEASEPQYRSVPMVLRSGLENPTVITQRDVDRLRLLTLANLAVCYLRTGRYSDCAESCTIAIFEAQRDLLGRNPTREAAIYSKEASHRLHMAIQRVDAAFLSVMGGRGAGDEVSSQRGGGAPSASASASASTSGSGSGTGGSRGVDAVAAVSPSVLALADRLREASPGGAPDAPGVATVPILSAANADRAAALDALVILLKALLRRAQARRRARVLDLAARDVAVGLLLCGGTAEVSEGAAHSGAEHAYVVLPELRPAFVAFSRERAWVRRAARAYREKRRRVGRRMGAGAMSGALSVAADPEVGEAGNSVTSDARSVLSGDSALSFHPGTRSGAGAGEDADDRRTAASVRADTALERDLEDEERSVFGGLRSVRGDGLSEGQGGSIALDEDEAVSLVGSEDRDSESEPGQGSELSFRLASLGASRTDRAHLTTQQLIEAAAGGAKIGSKEKYMRFNE